MLKAAEFTTRADNQSKEITMSSITRVTTSEWTVYPNCKAEINKT